MKTTFIGCIVAAALLISCTPASFDQAVWHQKVNRTRPEDLYAAHVRDGRFFNPWMPMDEKSLMTLVQWKVSTKRKYTEAEKSYLPGVLSDALERIRRHPGKYWIMWLGHGSFLLRIGDEYWLLDPILTGRALIIPRKTPPAIRIDQLGEIADHFYVLVSHNHYDHLDQETIEGIPDGSHIITPLGFKDCIEGYSGKKIVEEMDWWQTYESRQGTRITCLPAQHWSRRATVGTNKSLWAGFMIASGDRLIYFGGDSGYFIGYREFGRRFPGIDYALIPTTAYHPRWFMHYAHLNIDEALMAFDELGARCFIPTQWGTFHLGDEPPGYPALDLKRTIAARRLNPERFLLMDIGEIIDLEK